MDAYVECVIKAGGAPLLLPAVEDEQASVSLLTGVHGLIISGGGHDIDPMLYGEERLPECSPTNPTRETAEMAACRGALSRDMPVLGICGGMQVINIAAGGTLYQDIPSQVPDALTHRPENTDENTYTFHEIEIGDSILGEVLGSSSVVNSHHHQSAREVGPGVRVSARTEDGVIEAIESPSHQFVVGLAVAPRIHVGLRLRRYGRGGAALLPLRGRGASSTRIRKGKAHLFRINPEELPDGQATGPLPLRRGHGPRGA